MNDLKKAAEHEFAGADLESLREYCDEMGVEYHPNMNADTLRKRLNQALGEYREDAGDDNQPLNIDVSDRQARIKELVSYNLRSTGRWEGKRRVITLTRSMSHDNTTRPQFFAWGRLHCYIPFGERVAIPYPIYQILLDTRGKQLHRKRRVDDEGRVFFEEEWRPTERFMYSDFGDDPETINRPEDERDRLRMLYNLTDGFNGFSTRQFRAMALALHIRPEKDWDAADFKGAVLSRIGMVGSRVDLSTPEEAVA